MSNYCTLQSSEIIFEVFFSVILAKLFYVEITSHLFPQFLLVLRDSACEYAHVWATLDDHSRHGVVPTY